MQSPLLRRVAAYGGASAILAGLVWAGWMREVSATPGTLIAAASAQMQLAYGVRGDSNDARALRTRLASEAEDLIERAAAQAPQNPSVFVARGDLSRLRGDVDSALTFYESAIGTLDADVEAVGMLRGRRAEILVDVQRFDEAQHEIGRLRKLGGSRNETKCVLLEATILNATERLPDAVKLVESHAARGDIDASVTAGSWLEDAGEFDAAERAFRAPSVDAHIADYHAARLKLRTGEIDTAMDLLSRAVHHDRSSVLELLQLDRAHWNSCRGNERFERILDSEGSLAAPR